MGPLLFFEDCLAICVKNLKIYISFDLAMPFLVLLLRKQSCLCGKDLAVRIFLVVMLIIKGGRSTGRDWLRQCATR